MGSLFEKFAGISFSAKKIFFSIINEGKLNALKRLTLLVEMVYNHIRR